jgi:hypothetical protein
MVENEIIFRVCLCTDAANEGVATHLKIKLFPQSLTLMDIARNPIVFTADLTTVKG